MALFFSTSSFEKSLLRLDLEVQKRVKEKLKFLSQQKNPILFARKLRGQKDIFRFRVGDFRIVFQRSEKKIILLLVKHRRDVYQNV